jgi:integrase/recombinase XerD
VGEQVAVAEPVEYITMEQAIELENQAECARDLILIRLLRRLGCRISEALGIECDQVDFRNKTITIEHLKTRIKLACPHCGYQLGKGSVFCQKCGAKVEKAVVKEKAHKKLRKIPVDAETLRMLKYYIEKTDGPVMIRGKRMLFGIGRCQAWKLVTYYARKAGLPEIRNAGSGKLYHVSPHKLRDAFAINAIQQNDSGDGVRLLQELMGHAKYDTTMRYRKVKGEEVKDYYGTLFKEDQNKVEEEKGE